MSKLATTIVVGSLFLFLGSNPSSAFLTQACESPALPAPTGSVIQVATESTLQNAVSSVTSENAILIQPGIYNLTRTLWLNNNANNMTIRENSDSCDAAVLVGRGMNNTNYGNIPHGIWIGNARNVLIANLTIRDVCYYPIQLDPNADAQAPHIYNVRMVDVGEQFVKSSASTSGAVGVNNGIVEYSIMEHTTTARSHYTNGVDVHQGTRSYATISFAISERLSDNSQVQPC